MLVMLFALVEHLVEGWIHRRGLVDGLHEIAAEGAYEIGARMLTLTAAFVPFFAFNELGRVPGMHRLADLFFARQRPAAVDPEPPA